MLGGDNVNTRMSKLDQNLLVVAEFCRDVSTAPINALLNKLDSKVNEPAKEYTPKQMATRGIVVVGSIIAVSYISMLF